MVIFSKKTETDMKYAPALQRAIMLVMSSFGDQRRVGPQSVPAYTHSLGVGLSLIKYNYSLEVVLGGFLHDTIEDTGVTGELIEQLFGARVRAIVEACSFLKVLGDTIEGENELRERVIALAGSGDVEPLIVKCADSLDNLKTNAHLRAEYQTRAMLAGYKWLHAGQQHLQGHLLVDDLKVVVDREHARIVP